MKYENKRIVIEPRFDGFVLATLYDGATVLKQRATIVPDASNEDGLAEFGEAAAVALMLLRWAETPKTANVDNLKVGSVVRLTKTTHLFFEGATGLVSWVDDAEGKCGVTALGHLTNKLETEPIRFDCVTKLDID